MIRVLSRRGAIVVALVLAACNTPSGVPVTSDPAGTVIASAPPAARPSWQIKASVTQVRSSAAQLTYQIELAGFPARTTFRLVDLRDPDQRELDTRFTLVVPSSACRYVGSLPLKAGSYRFRLEEGERTHTVHLDVWASFLDGRRPVAEASRAPDCEVAS